MCLLDADRPRMIGINTASTAEFVRKADGVSDAMLTADYWIDKLKDPDKVLMTKESIAKWNEMVL